MTTTAILSGVSLGTSTNIGQFFNPVKTALQAATTTVKLSSQLTLGAASGANASSRVKVWQAVSPISYGSALLGAQALFQGATYSLIRLDALATNTIEIPSELLVTAAGYHYCWVEAPTLTVAATLTVNLLEIP